MHPNLVSETGDAVAAVFLPNWTSTASLSAANRYKFEYNLYGELARVELPTGGAIEYDYGAGLKNPANKPGIFASGQVLQHVERYIFKAPNEAPPETPWHPFIYRRLTTRRVYESGSAAVRTTTYTPREYVENTEYFEPTGWIGIVTIKSDDPFVEETETATLPDDGGTVTKTIHHYYLADYNLSNSTGPAVSLSNAHLLGASVMPSYEGREFRSDVVGFRTVENAWGKDPGGNIRLCQTKTQLLDGASQPAAATLMAYDGYGNVTETYEYEYGVSLGTSAMPTFYAGTGSPTAEDRLCSAPADGWTRRTHTAYQTDADYVGPTVNLRSLPTLVEIWGPSGMASQTNLIYDEAAGAPQSALPVDSARLAPVTGKRGNLTTYSKLVRYAGEGDSTIATAVKYDSAGNRVQVTQPGGAVTNFTYVCDYGLLESTVLPLLSPQNRDTERYRTTVTPDCNTGQPTSIVEPNGTVTTVNYGSDPFDRPSSVSRGSALVNYSYNDGMGALSVGISKKHSGSRTIVSSEYYDRLKRKTKTTLGSGASMVETQWKYDGFDRPVKVSAPTTSGVEKAWTVTVYDALGRATSVTKPIGGAETTVYQERVTTVTDEAKRARVLTADALGRVVRVVEDPSVPNATPPHKNYETDYGYDVNGNLTSVTQGSQTRSFEYDSAGRLRAAVMPELGLSTDSNGRIEYRYDAAGNLYTRLAAGTTTTHTYDVINRLVSKTYTGTAAATPAVTMCYDGQTLSGSACTGTRAQNGAALRLSAARALRTDSAFSSISTYSYDPQGRVAGNTQTTTGLSGTATLSYLFNDDDTLQSITYPSNRRVSTCYDDLGRVNWLTDASGNIACTGSAPGGSYVTGTTYNYTADGLTTQTALGNTLVEARAQNVRGQLTSIGVTSGASSLLNLGLGYSATENNGNVLSQSISFSLPSPYSATQSYGYDYLNRLRTVTEGTVAQTFVYDRYGNRAQLNGSGQYIPGNSLTPQVSSDNESAVETLFPRNHWTLGGVGYDTAGAGNLAVLPSREMTYDAENRMTSSAVTAGGTTTTEYAYDGEGRRVKKGGTVYVYDAFGTLAAEYGGASVAAGRQYLTADHLGSTRLVTTSTGALDRRYDYVPFGEELFAGTGGRTTDMLYQAAPDSVNPRFTGQMRDNESGLDYFGARYYSGAQGGFTTPDPLNWLNWQLRAQPRDSSSEHSRLEEEKDGNLGSRAEFRQRLEDPQQLNLYTYVRNNPLRHTDPRGLWLAEGHTELTNFAMDGFAYGDVALAVRANIAVDELANQLNNPAHYMAGTGEKAEKLIASSLDSAVQLEVSGKHADAMKALGSGMHTVQDRYSHSAQNAGWKAHMNGSRPDDPKKHPKEFEKAKQASKQYVEAFRRRVEEEKKRRAEGHQ